LKNEYISHSQRETEELGEKLSKEIITGEVIALYGELGAGKTAFARGVLRGLGYTGIVNSPTFTIVNEYVLKECVVAHFDMYRVDDEETLATAGFFEHRDNHSTMLIEWSERAEEILDPSYIRVYIEGSGEDARKISVIRVDK